MFLGKKIHGNIYRGGPYYYIADGLGKKRLATIYALIILIAYIGGFMTIQVNTVTTCITDVFSIKPIIIGSIIAILSAITIFGGVKNIATTTSKLVPFMTLLYFSVCLYVIVKNYLILPQIFTNIINSAFQPKTAGIGILSTLLIGMQKGIFSSEVGLGTGSIAAVTADTENAGKNGMVQTFGIHFENLFIATITTIVICMSDYQNLIVYEPNGIEITLYAFKQHIGNIGPIIVTIIIALFGLSTVLTGYYYGESSLKFIKKTNSFDILILKIITVTVLLLASVASSEFLWKMTDFFVGIIAIINIYAIFSLRKIVIEEYKYYKTKKYNR